MSDKKDQPLNEDELGEVTDIVTSDEVSMADKNAHETPISEESSAVKVEEAPDNAKKKSSIWRFFGIVGSILGGFWRVTRIALLIGIVVGSLFAAAYVLQQDELVRSQFEGKRWALPARVFARPLELYEGQSLKADDLQKELQLLNYSFVTHLVGTGQFKRDKNTFHVQTRGFKFSEDQEISRRILIQVKKDKIVKLENTESSEPLTLMRLEPVLIGNFYPHHNEDRVLVKLDDVSPLLVKGLVAVEDRTYYDHFGVNPKSILRAVIANAKAGRKVQGGSTLTQQLVKNFFLTNEQSYKRKANEAIMAMLLEVHYSKEEILEAYMNEIFLGQNKQRSVHGFGLASQYYFNKPIKELKPEQIALLIGVTKGASYYNPRRYPKRATERRNLVLDIMAREGVLDKKDIAGFKSKPLGVTVDAPPSVSPFPSYLELVKKQLKRDYNEEDLRSEGLLIFTAMDPVIQIQAEEVLNKRIKKLEKSKRMKKDKLNGAMVVSSVQGAEILAVVGGRDARFAGYNRALNAHRQIGSLIKPVVYLAALEDKKYNLATPIDAGPVTVRLSKSKIWEPKNYSDKDQGMVSFESALVHSINTPTVRIGITIGLDKVINELHALGLQKEIQPNPSLLLGAIELSPMEVQQIYQTIAAGGTYTPLTAIRSVMNSYGKALKRYPLQVKQVVSEESVYLLTHAMNKITKEGTAQYLKRALPAWKNAAGKTGTTNKNVDSWFAGFTGQHVVSVWVGRDDNKPTGFTGSAGALRVWGDLMKLIPTKPFKPKRPRNVKLFKVNSMTGLLYNPSCGEGEVLPFVVGSEPNDIYECPPLEMFIEAGTPSWGDGASFVNPSNPSDATSGSNGATIWDNNKRINQPEPQPQPKVERDSGLWIDDLMQR
jgi:penicillin-binding protein 1B